MSKCDVCRKDTALDSWWDKLRYFLFKRLFPKDFIDLAEEKYTKGFGEGYVKGLQSAADHKEKLADVQKQFFEGQEFFGSTIKDIPSEYDKKMAKDKISRPPLSHAYIPRGASANLRKRRVDRRGKSTQRPRGKSFS